jgi:peptidyl-prolyl cis-trans isomerase D
MLGIMRKYKESIIIKIIFVIIVASFIGTIFLVWGKGGDEGLSANKSYAAKVNGTKISPEEYQQTYYRLRSIYEQLYGKSISPEIEKTLNLRKQALDSLVEQALVAQAAKTMNIKVSKDDVAAAIAARPEFQKDGGFDFSLYQQMLKGNRITPNDFEESQKQELIIKKARQQIKDKVTVSDEDAKTFFHKKNDKIELSYVTFVPAALKGEVKLTDQELTTYLQSHQEQFKSPEQVSIQYTLLDPATIVSKVSITDEEVQTFYQKNIDRYQGKGGILPLAEVKDKVKADALKAKAAKQAYELAADAANKFLAKADLAAAATSLGSKVQETELFAATKVPAALTTEAELIKRAFATKTGELGGPVETAKGIYLLKIKERTPAAVPSLDKIKAQVESFAAVDKAKEVAKTKAEETLATLGKGGSAVKLLDTGSFGYAENGLIPKLGPSLEMMEAAFNLTTAAPLPKTPFKQGDSWVVIKMKNRAVADTAAFTATKEQIKQQILPKKQQEAMDAWIKELKAKAKIELNEALLAN